MAGYRADIEIGVKGLRDLQTFRREVDVLSKGITDVNNSLNGAAQSLNNYNRNLQTASRNINAVNAGTIAERDAISQYVRALGEANTARERQNRLILEQIEAQRKARLAASGIRETTQFPGPIGPGPASPIGALVGQKSPVEERIRRTIVARKEEADLQTALLRLEERSAQEVNKKVQAQQALVAGTREVYELTAQTNRQQQFLAGRSGSALQGPLQALGPNPLLASSASAAGFRVALPLTKAEQATLDILRKRQEVLNRILKQRQKLSTLAANLQKLENQSTVAIADAKREQQQLTEAKERELQISKQSALLAGKFSPIGGAENIPGSPAFLAAQRKRRREQISGVALGAGFPLLFGGGPGAVIGGALGGLVPGPGKFAAEIAFSALGQQFDKLASAAGQLGTALNPLTLNVDKIAEASGVAGTKTQEYLNIIEKYATKAEAAEAATRILASRIGTDGVKALKKFGEDAQKLGNQLSIIFTRVLENISRLVGPLLSRIASGLERGNLVEGFKTRTGLTGREAVAQQILSTAARRQGRGAIPSQVKNLGEQIGLTGTAAQIIEQAKTIGAASQKALQNQLDTALQTRAEQLELEAQPKGPKGPTDRTAQLRADLEAFKAISAANDRIRDALFDGNKELAIKFTYDKQIADINRDTEKALLSANFQSEKAVIRALQIVRIKDAQLQRDDDLKELARDINEIITNTLDDLRGGVSWEDTGLRDIFDLKLPDAIKETQENLKNLVDPAQNIINAATAIGDAFEQSFTRIITGAVSARQGLADFFKNLGDYFVNAAGRIAAEALKLQAINVLQSLLSPLLGPKFGVSGLTLPGLEGTGALAPKPLFKNGVFAEGGFVTSPTRALIGEGGESEYVIPASKMKSAMNRYAAGARGNAVLSGGDETSGSGMATMAPAAIDVRYNVERINNVDYVTNQEFQAGLQQAASQGAERGQQLALRRLQQSVTTRRRLGI